MAHTHTHTQPQTHTYLSVLPQFFSKLTQSNFYFIFYTYGWVDRSIGLLWHHVNTHTRAMAHTRASNNKNQMFVGILFIIIGSMNINRNNEQKAAIILNDVILVLVFLITILNVMISAFGIEHSSKPLQKINN